MNINELFEGVSAQVAEDIEQEKAESGKEIRYDSVKKSLPLKPSDKFFLILNGYSAHVSLNDEKELIEFELWCLERTDYGEAENVKKDVYLININEEIIQYHNTSILNVWKDFENIESLSKEIIKDFLKFTELQK